VRKDWLALCGRGKQQWWHECVFGRGGREGLVTVGMLLKPGSGNDRVPALSITDTWFL
jgi:hypothetical protein